MSKNILIALFGLAVIIASCGDDGSEASEKKSGDQETSTDRPEKGKDEKAKAETPEDQEEPSKLTLFMRMAEEHMKAAREDVMNKRQFNDTLSLGFGPVGYYEASEHVAQDEEEYAAYTQSLLDQTTALLAADPADRTGNYNLVVKSCIGCHEVYCPGPITRIRKLMIKQK